MVAITGGAGGIGFALAEAFAEVGYRVGLSDIDDERLQAAAERLRSAGAEVHATVVDVRTSAALRGWAAELEAEFGGVDVLVNNAGTLTWGAFADMSEDEVDLILDLNLKAAVHGCRVFAPLLRRSSKGHIVNVASMSGLFSSPFQTTYCASKWGLRGFSQALRMEMRTEGIGVTCVMPGTIATDFMKRARTHDAANAKTLAAGMHRVGASPRRVATKTLRAIRWNFGEQLVGLDAYLVAFAQRCLPGLIPFIINRAYPRFEGRLRPKSGGQPPG